MLEYIVIFIIVGVAAFFTIRKLIRDAKGGSCDSCACECDIPEQMKKIAEIAEKTKQENSASSKN